MIDSIATLNESKLNSNLAYATVLAQSACCQEGRTACYSAEGLHHQKYYQDLFFIFSPLKTATEEHFKIDCKMLLKSFLW